MTNLVNGEKLWRKANGKFIKNNSSGKLIRCTHCPCESSGGESVCRDDLLTFSRTMVIEHQSATALYDENDNIIGYELTDYEKYSNEYRLVENSVSASENNSGECVLSVKYQLKGVAEDAGVTLSFSSSAEFLGASYYGDLGYYTKNPVIPTDKQRNDQVALGVLATIFSYLSTIKSGRPTTN